MKATARDLRYKTKEIMDAIDRGEEVLITYRGKKKAKIVPVLEKREGAGGEENRLFGIWHDNETVSDVDAYMNNVRGGRFGAC